MKKIVAIITLAFLITSCGAKEFNYRNSYTDEVLDGIFKLRIGMSVAALKAVVDTTLLESKEIAKHYEQYEIFRGRIKEFSLKQYTPADGHVIENVNFYFLDDKLYKITVLEYNGKTDYLLTKKYGEPKIKKGKYKTSGEYRVKTPSNLRTSIWDEYTTKSWTHTIKYSDLIWPTNAENITCYYSSNKFLYIENINAQQQIRAEDKIDLVRRIKEIDDYIEAQEKKTEQLLDKF